MNAATATINRLGLDLPVVVAFGCIIILLLGGALYSPEFLSPEYLLQQLQAGEFCYVLTPRQMGKSSLMVRTAQRLSPR